jgi:hypothetical protein
MAKTDGMNLSAKFCTNSLFYFTAFEFPNLSKKEAKVGSNV